MLAFEIFINGKKRFTAGGAEYQTLNTNLALIHTQLPKPDDACILFSTSGINPEPLLVGSWPIEELTVGDRVEIRVVEVAEVDPPETVETPERGDDNVDASQITGQGSV